MQQYYGSYSLYISNIVFNHEFEKYAFYILCGFNVLPRKYLDKYIPSSLIYGKFLS